jgi:aminoglycoside 3-N-acetyltransferase
MHSRERFAADLRALGIAPGDVVMTHASVRAVGEVAGGPDQIQIRSAPAVRS